MRATAITDKDRFGYDPSNRSDILDDNTRMEAGLIIGTDRDFTKDDDSQNCQIAREFIEIIYFTSRNVMAAYFAFSKLFFLKNII